MALLNGTSSTGTTMTTTTTTTTGMASALSSTNGGLDFHDGLRSRAAKTHLKPDGSAIPDDDALSSGRSTPLPQDAPPSVRSIHHAKKQKRRKLFPTVNYEERVSHFDPQSQHRDFRGFFTLFWVGLFIMVLTTGVRNVKETGRVFRTSIFALFTEDLQVLALSDLVMVASTSLTLPLHKVWRARLHGVGWGNGGYICQYVLQLIWLSMWVYWPFARRWVWTHQVFFTLHALVLLMKMHSYAFYNGHLCETERKLHELDSNTLSTEPKSDTALREVLAFELTSPTGMTQYPRNLTWNNFLDYLLCPTLCYEIEYPRTPSVRWNIVAEKAAAVFGCVFLLTLTSEEFIAPVMRDASAHLQQQHTVSDALLVLGESINLLLFPFLVSFLLVFLVIFEYVLGAFAEITRFADRRFYSDWWNSCNWLEFSREWNIPVHHWFKRHVYGASREHVSRTVATFITFLISSILHELVLFCLVKKVRGYGFFCQMLQLPIVMLQSLPWLSRQKALLNCFFWISMILGLSMNCALYVLF
ncbi:hypothetical protein DRE_01400 [Drechslerella stenobrocha 248]|uniref:O-acyltransferase n=1 Tax=Drechslerella stenobrocha 248 TaxID=1043628 RepID=W7HVY1_9PEZI|nr:hypothetical protein DRE_01400 [Drechslerella stenobrocha 248]